MATKYTVVLSDSTEFGTRARKDTAIKLGETQGMPFTVRTDSGAVVHTHLYGDPTPETPEAPAPAEQEEDTVAPKTAAKKTTAKAPKVPAQAPAPEAEAEEERVGTELEFETLGKYYVRSAGLHGAEVVGAVYGVEASLKGTTLTLYGADEDIEEVVTQLRSLWAHAKEAHREYRKTDKVYSAIDKSRKNKEANAERWHLEVAWFMGFMDGAADALADTVKRKGGAYKDGVNAVQNPAPVDEAADVI